MEIIIFSTLIWNCSFTASQVTLCGKLTAQRSQLKVSLYPLIGPRTFCSLQFCFGLSHVTYFDQLDVSQECQIHVNFHMSSGMIILSLFWISELTMMTCMLGWRMWGTHDWELSHVSHLRLTTASWPKMCETAQTPSAKALTRTAVDQGAPEITETIQLTTDTWAVILVHALRHCLSGQFVKHLYHDNRELMQTLLLQSRVVL